MSDKIGKHFLEDALQTFRDYKQNTERAFAQTSDEDFFATSIRNPTASPSS